jgi:2-polyprenyl-6-methoxyphenol hydroxylase-like FAD-dependent oxidoreductase
MNSRDRIVVLGGGPAGVAAAQQLHANGRAVVLLDRTVGRARSRGEVLPPVARTLLRELDLHEAVMAMPSTPCHGVWSVWGEDQLYEKNFIFNAYGDGLHVERSAFARALLCRTEACGVDVRRETKVRHVQALPDGTWILHVECAGSASELVAGGVIDATGRACWLGRSLGGTRVAHDRQIALAGRLVLSAADPFAGITLVEAIPEGWCYSSPLPDGALSVVVLSDSDLLRMWRMPPAAVWARLSGQARYTQERMERCHPSGQFELETVMADTYRVRVPSGAACALAGAAALGLDPLSSSGICYALQSGRDAALALEAHLEGSALALGDHEKACDAYCADFLREQHIHYLSESRFAASAYWRRRHAGPASGNPQLATAWPAPAGLVAGKVVIKTREVQAG